MRKFAIWLFDEQAYLLAKAKAKTAGVPVSRWIADLIKRDDSAQHPIQKAHREMLKQYDPQPIPATFESTCTRCKHPVSKHTPACYVAACNCRKAVA